MDQLPHPATSRQLVHTRTAEYRGFLREDGLWDIEGELRDTKPFDVANADGVRKPAGEPVHNMLIRLTIGDDMVVREVFTALPFTPFPECAGTEPPMQEIVGVRLGAGWRQAIDKALGKTRGCTHLRELLFNMASAAYQSVTGWRHMQHRVLGKRVDGEMTQPPPHMGQCIAWDFNGPVIARNYPQFVNWQPKK